MKKADINAADAFPHFVNALQYVALHCTQTQSIFLPKFAQYLDRILLVVLQNKQTFGWGLAYLCRLLLHSTSLHWNSEAKFELHKKSAKIWVLFNTFLMRFTFTLMSLYSYFGFSSPTPCASSYPCRDQAWHTKPANLQCKELHKIAQNCTSQHCTR